MPPKDQIPAPTMPPPEERHSLFEEASKEAHRHKWIESEKAGYDLGDGAIRDWHKKFWRTFCRECYIEHVRGETYWTELDNGDFGLLVNKFQENTAELVDQIVLQLTTGGENLDVIQWAIREQYDTQEVLQILGMLDINSRRLAPAIAIDEQEFVEGIRARHHVRGLIVDDDPSAREILSNLLQAEGMDCISVSTGEEALEEVQARRFDMFLIDIMLPGKHGAEVAWYLRRHGVKSPVVAISAALEIWDKDDLLDCGFTDLMSKPFNLDRIRQIVRDVIHHTNQSN